MTYDKTVHDITVTVTDDGTGKLVATVEGNNPTFTNTYSAPTPTPASGDKSSSNNNAKTAPTTGDTISGVVGLFGAGLLGVGLLAYTRRRRKDSTND